MTTTDVPAVPAVPAAHGTLAPELDVTPGMTVMVCLNRDPLVLRPLVVTMVAGPRVDGLLVFHDDADHGTEWVRTWCKVLPSPQQPAAWARGLTYGHGVGRWRYLGDYR